MDSFVVVCYSRTGTSRQAAELLCRQEGWPLGTIRDVQPRTGWTGMLRCAVDALLGLWPPIRYEGPAPEDFRTVVLVAPVWMGRLAAPARTFLREHRLQRVAAIVTARSGDVARSLDDVRALVGRPLVLSLTLTTGDLKSGSGKPLLLATGSRLRPLRAVARSTPLGA